MFWIVLMVVMCVLVLALQGVMDLVQYIENEDEYEYETAYVIV